MAGLNLEQFRVYGPGPVEPHRPDYSWIGGIGDAIAHGRHADEQAALQQQQLERETQRDVRNDSRERVGQEQRAREMLMNDKRAGQREDLYRTQENRRQESAMYERNHLLKQEHEALFRRLQEAKARFEATGNPLDGEAAEEAAKALEREGYHVKRPDAVPAAPPQASAPAPYVPANTGEAQDAAEAASAAKTGEAMDAKKRPMLPGERKRLSKDLSTINKNPAAGGKATVYPSLAPSGSSDLSTIDTNPAAGGEPTVYPQMDGARAPLPGENPFVTRSSLFLSPDDPYNNIR